VDPKKGGRRKSTIQGKRVLKGPMGEPWGGQGVKTHSQALPVGEKVVTSKNPKRRRRVEGNVLGVNQLPKKKRNRARERENLPNSEPPKTKKGGEKKQKKVTEGGGGGHSGCRKPQKSQDCLLREDEKKPEGGEKPKPAQKVVPSRERETRGGKKR